MQYEIIKDDLPTYILSGYVREDNSMQTKKDLFTTLIKCDRAHIDSLVTGNSTWHSITVFEMPKESIYDFSIDELKEHRRVLAERETNRRRYELFLKLKKEFEPESVI